MPPAKDPPVQDENPIVLPSSPSSQAIQALKSFVGSSKSLPKCFQSLGDPRNEFSGPTPGATGDSDSSGGGPRIAWPLEGLKRRSRRRHLQSRRRLTKSRRQQRRRKSPLERLASTRFTRQCQARLVLHVQFIIYRMVYYLSRLVLSI